MPELRGKKVVCAMSPKQFLWDARGQIGGVRRKKKVVVAMSGGVDSSVAAALLKKAGVDELRSSSRTSSLERVRKNFNSFDFANARAFNVIGVFMKLWPEKYFSSDAQKTVERVTSQLGIPFLVFDLTKEFKKKVVDYFLKEYQRGKTPNPCVECNREIKFGLFFKKALELKADYIATGHYAKIRKFVNSKQIRYSLISAKDTEKEAIDLIVTGFLTI